MTSALERFARETLGCNCAPAVFQQVAEDLVPLPGLAAPVRRIAMTGEITLTGEVFPIGGVREKLIAARRAGIKEIILPEDNRGEFEEVPEHVRKGLLIHFATRFQDVVPLLFK